MNNMFYGHRYPYTDFHELNLDWVLEQITEFQTKLNEWSELAQQLQEALGDINDMKSDIATLQNLVSAIQTSISDLDAIRTKLVSLQATDESQQLEIDALKSIISGIEADFDAVYAYFNSKIANEIALIKLDYRKDLLDLYNAFNGRFLVLQSEIDLIADELKKIDTTLINPWHWELGKVSPDENNKLIYADLADECLTAEQYCSLGLSADDFKKYDLTALNYAKFGKTKLHFRWVYSPTFGFKQEISNVLTSIVNFIKETITADDYAALDLSADDYVALDMTSLEYYSFNSNRYVRDGGDGLTSAEYSTLQLI